VAILLHIETATTVCSVALSDNEKVIAQKETNQGYTHAENLTLFISEVAEQAGINLKQIDAVVISKGPGSYTGLRIGYSVAKGLCYALDKPLIAVDTLQSMAKQYLLQFPETSNVLLCPMIDARRMEVYCAVYDQHLHVVKPVAAEIIDSNSFCELLNENEMIFFGDGATKCAEHLSHSNATIVGKVVPSSAAMCLAGYEKFKQQLFEDVAYCEPFYLKDFVAGIRK
jgi:tRNA threonylcarbamoyladenosine biosynthesis protein TsaB